MQHTPGPWTVTVRRGRVIVLDANRNEVCDAFAEAPLIAAAPALLRVAQALAEANCSEAVAFAAQLAHAAIAQAKGEQ